MTKHHSVEIAKEVAEDFLFDYRAFSAKYSCTEKCRDFLVSQYPNLKDCPWDWECIHGDKIIFRFYSLGDAVIVDLLST